MKTIIPKTILLTAMLTALIVLSSVAQRVVTGTVYREGKPAAGVTVEANKSSETFMTSFDGKYEIKVPDKCKFLKFTFIDDSRKLDIESNTSNVIDFSFDGAIPAASAAEEKGVNLKSQQELIAAGDKDFMSNMSIYPEFYKQKDYKSAMGPWRKLYRSYPKSTLNLYIHGANMYQDCIEKAKDVATKKAYIDSLMQLYDRRIKYFDQKGYVLGRQGTDYIKYYTADTTLNLSDSEMKTVLKKGYNYLDESIKLQGNESEAPTLLVYLQVTRKLYSLGEFQSDKVVENYDITSKIINNYLAKEPTEEKYTTTRDYLDQIFQTSGAANCESLVAIYTPKFNEIAKDLDALKKMLRILEKQDCTESPLFAKASEKLYELEPSAEAAFNMARMFVKTDFAKAKGYYKQAIDAETDKELLGKYYYELAAFTFAKENDAPSTRNYLRKSIDNNPNYGKAYLLMGDVIAYGAKSVGTNDFEKSAVYWLAVDYFSKAKKVDPEVTVTANEKINLYSQYFPSKEDIFFNG
jgi:tetratricopeptide (TPR) repeat protein